MYGGYDGRLDGRPADIASRYLHGNITGKFDGKTSGRYACVVTASPSLHSLMRGLLYPDIENYW
jgi:hypothetical protein